MQSTMMQASQNRIVRASTAHPVAARGACAPALSMRAQLSKAGKLSALKQSNSVAAAVPAARQQVVVAAAAAKKTVVITGASSGLGLQAARALAASGDWHVVMACRDFPKAVRQAKSLGMPQGSYSVMHLDLASLDSVRQFVKQFRASGMSLNALVANAAVYLPVAKEPTFTAEGFELSVGTNHLGHFLLCNLLMEDLKKAQDARMIIVGSITGNTNTLAGNVPPKADLGDLRGLAAGFQAPNVMIDGGEFDGAKAYKDSKVCNMLTMREFDRRYAASTGITFASLYPGCIAETGLFRNHVGLFRKLFPVFQKYVTKGYVSEEEAGRRLAKVVSDPSYNQSGAYWSWVSENEAFVNTPSEEVTDGVKGQRLWELSEQLVGLKSSGATSSKAPEAVPQMA